MTSDGVAVEAVDPAAVERARTAAAEADRVVVKAGTNSLTDEDSRLDRVKLDKLVADVMDLRRRGKEVVVVSSGAVGAGIGRLGNGDGIVDVDIDVVLAVGKRIEPLGLAPLREEIHASGLGPTRLGGDSAHVEAERAVDAPLILRRPVA